ADIGAVVDLILLGLPTRQNAEFVVAIPIDLIAFQCNRRISRIQYPLTALRGWQPLSIKRIFAVHHEYYPVTMLRSIVAPEHETNLLPRLRFAYNSLTIAEFNRHFRAIE